MMNPYNDYTPFLAHFEFGVKMCSKSFVGMELLRTIVSSQFPRQSINSYCRASQNGLPFLVVASSTAVKWSMVEMGSDMCQPAIGPIEDFCTGSPV